MITKDTYPINVKPMFNAYKVLAIIFGLIIIFLVYKTCHPTPSPTLLPVTSIPEQKERVRIDTVENKQKNDILEKRVDSLKVVAATAIFDRDNAQADNVELQKEIDDVLSQPVPDTCKAVVAQISSLNQKLKQSSINAQNACNSTINAKNAIISNKDNIIKNNNTLVNNLRRAVDTALEQQRKSQRNVDLLTPKNEFYAGLNAIGSKEKYLAAYGASVGLRNTKGNQYEIGAFQMGSNIYYQFSIKKVLFRFKLKK